MIRWTLLRRFPIATPVLGTSNENTNGLLPGTLWKKSPVLRPDLANPSLQCGERFQALKRVSAFTKPAVGGKEDSDDDVARFREPSALAFRGVGLLRHADRSVLIRPSINKEIIYFKLNMETGQLRYTAICEGWA
jgi:hypothetical protein